MKKLLFLIIIIQITLFAKPFIPLKSGATVEGHVNYLEKKYYALEVNKEQTVTIKLTNLVADVDIYLGINKKPKIHSNDCYSSNSNTENEECILTVTPDAGKTNSVIVMVYGFKESTYKLEVISKDGAEELPTLTDTPMAGQVKKGESKQYKFLGKKGETYTSTLSNLSADADLRVSIGRRAGLRTFTCKSINGGTNTDECSVTLKEDAPVYVQVYGYKAANYKIQTVLKVANENEELIKKAKEFCQNKSNFVKPSYICSIEQNIVYIMKYFQLGYEDQYKVYRININPNSESVELTLNKQLLSSSDARFIPLKDTTLVGITTSEDHGDLVNYQNFYHKGKELQMSLLYQGYSEPYSNTQGTAETIKKGKELRVTYKKFVDRNDGWVKFEDIYDIRDTSNIKKPISHKKI